MNKIFGGAAILVTLACSSAPAAESSGNGGNRTLPSCESCPEDVIAVPSAWVAVIDDTGEYQLRLPPTMRPAPGKYVYIHGGQAWEDEQLDVSISFDHWAEYSFDDLAGSRCRVDVNGTSVYLVVATDRVLAWYDRQSGSHEPSFPLAVSHGSMTSRNLSRSRYRSETCRRRKPGHGLTSHCS